MKNQKFKKIKKMFKKTRILYGKIRIINFLSSANEKLEKYIGVAAL